jgi:flagellar capping protein FliD
MGTLGSAIKAYNQTGTGLLTLHKTDLQNRAKSMTNSMNREQDRLDRYQALLQKQFAAMDTSVTANNSDMGYLSRLYSSSSG